MGTDNKINLSQNIKMSNLVSRLQEGDKEALKEVFNTYYYVIFNYINSRIQNYHDAQDLTSEIFVALIQNIQNFKGNSSFKNYLFGIIKNKIKDYLKSKKLSYDTFLFSDLTVDIDQMLVDSNVNTNFNKRAVAVKVIDYIMKVINPRYAMVLNLKYKKMYSSLEIARKLNLSLNNLKVLEHRALKKAALIWSQLDKNVKEKLLSK